MSAPADSFVVTVANRVVLDIAAPAALVWSYLPGLRKRPRAGSRCSQLRSTTGASC